MEQKTLIAVAVITFANTITLIGIIKMTKTARNNQYRVSKGIAPYLKVEYRKWFSPFWKTVKENIILEEDAIRACARHNNKRDISTTIYR